MCFGPRKTVKLEIGDMADELVSVEEDEKEDSPPDVDEEDETEDAVLLSNKERSDSMIFPGGTARDEYAEIGSSSENNGCDSLCRCVKSLTFLFLSGDRVLCKCSDIGWRSCPHRWGCFKSAHSCSTSSRL